jgi:glycosyltransferase involved in cell wall biosynthesis
MFKVLVIAYYFPPMGLSGIQRNFKFVKYMKSCDWEPTVITTGDLSYYVFDEQLEKELDNTGVRVIRTTSSNVNSNGKDKRIKKLPHEFFRKISNRIGQTFFIPDSKKSWSKKAYAIAEELLTKEKFNAIFVSGPPFSAMNIFSRIKTKYNIPLILDYSDLWSESYFSFYPTPLHKSLHKNLEYNALKTADKVIAANRKIKESLLHKYQFLTFNDVVIITNGFDPEDFQNTAILPKHNNRMILTYSGIFLLYNTPKYFLKAFKEISIERPDLAKNIELHFIGFLRKENEKLVRKLNLQEFVYNHGFLNHADATRILMSSDVLWMTVNNKKKYESVLPGKVYEYIGTKKPIIGCVPEGAAKMVLQEYAGSYICKPDDIAEIKETILRVYEHYQTGKFPEVDDEFLTQIRRDFLTEKLTKEFQFLVKAELR